MNATTFRWFKVLIIIASLLLAVLVGYTVAHAHGPKVSERCTITVVQSRYIAGRCPATGHVFGANTSRRFTRGQWITVTGYLEYDGEIAYPQVSR